MSPEIYPNSLAANAPPAARREWVRIFGSAVAIFLAMVVVSPLVQSPSWYEWEWLHTLSELYRTPVRYGVDVIFTFGPWGFTYGGYHPKTFAITCTVWLVLGALIGLAGSAVLFQRPRGVSVTASAVLAIGWALLFGGDNCCFADSRLFFFPFALLLSYFFIEHRRFDWLTIALAVAVAFTATIKLTYLTTGLIAVGAVTVDQLLARNWRMWALFASVPTFLIAWLGGGQSLADLRPFISSSLEVIRGYTYAMGLDAPGNSVAIFSFIFIVAGTLVLTMRGQKRPRWWLATGAISALSLLVFRASFIRHDWHAVIASSWLCTTMPLLAWLRWPKIPTSSRLLAIAMCISIAALQQYEVYRFESSPLERVAAWVNRFVDQAYCFATGRPTIPGIAYEQRMQRYRQRCPLNLSGTVDLIPYETDVLLANHLDYRPRPTLQSYAAYTPILAKANADYYAGPHRPDHVLFQASAIDQRPPSMEDNLLWRTLLERYQLDREIGGFLLLSPRATPRELSLTPISRFTAEVNHAFSVPAPPHGGLLWAKIRVVPTPFGRLCAQLYKPPQINFFVITGEQTLTNRFMPKNAAEGFLFGPYIFDNAAFVEALAHPESAGKDKRLMPQQAIVLTADDAWSAHYLKPQLTVEFFELR